MYVVMLHGITAFRRQEVVVNKGLGAFRGKLHHHTGWRVGIHIGILASNIIVLNVHNIEKNITCLCFAGYRTLVTISDIALSYILTTGFHQLHLYRVLDLLHGHLRISLGSDAVGDRLKQTFVLPFFRT